MKKSLKLKTATLATCVIASSLALASGRGDSLTSFVLGWFLGNLQRLSTHVVSSDSLPDWYLSNLSGTIADQMLQLTAPVEVKCTDIQKAPAPETLSSETCVISMRGTDHDISYTVTLDTDHSLHATFRGNVVQVGATKR